jgi:hypothetical protein
MDETSLLSQRWMFKSYVLVFLAIACLWLKSTFMGVPLVWHIWMNFALPLLFTKCDNEDGTEYTPLYGTLINLLSSLFLHKLIPFGDNEFNLEIHKFSTFRLLVSFQLVLDDTTKNLKSEIEWFSLWKCWLTGVS